MRKVAVIGSGFSGLSAACHLAKAGYEVTVFEKNDSPGGRARAFEAQGFTFDMGPSWYWMPDVFERFFAQFGKSASNYYTLQRLDPSYRIYYGANDYTDIPAGIPALTQLVESFEPGAGKRLAEFLEEGRYKYEIGINELVYKPGRSITELLDLRLLTGVLRLHVFQSISTYVRKYFRHPRLVQWLEFPVLFLGAKPQKTPALYSLMNYADMALGTWYPKGGMFKIIEGMVQLAKSLGVQFRYSSEITGYVIDKDRITSVRSQSEDYTCDYVVASGDYHHMEQKVLPQEYRKYAPGYWEKRVMAPSSLIFYIGISKKLNGLLHHTLFFDEDFGTHANEIYENPRWPARPQFYVSCPSQTDSSVAPPGCENIFILIPVAPGLQDTDEMREHYFTLIMERFERLIGQKVVPHIIFKRSYAHRDFQQDYHAFKGNAYGLANTLLQTAHLKPSLVNNKVRNLFYCGQLTVPGPGVPPSLISGEVVAGELTKQDQRSKR